MGSACSGSERATSIGAFASFSCRPYKAWLNFTLLSFVFKRGCKLHGRRARCVCCRVSSLLQPFFMPSSLPPIQQAHHPRHLRLHRRLRRTLASVLPQLPARPGSPPSFRRPVRPLLSSLTRHIFTYSAVPLIVEWCSTRQKRRSGTTCDGVK